jgi:carbamoyl-phosphate synthase small subunit
MSIKNEIREITTSEKMSSLKNKTAKLILEDRSEFEGISFGYEGNTNGEVVFNTGMVGYPETLTDPSYRGQILTCTFPLIGNYGVPERENLNGVSKNFESDSIHVRGLIVSNYSDQYSHWSAKKSLGDWLEEEKIPAITGIDTRMLLESSAIKVQCLGKIVINQENNMDFSDPNTN